MKLSKPTKSKLSDDQKQKHEIARLKIEKQISQQIEACEKSNKITASDLLFTIKKKKKK